MTLTARIVVCMVAAIAVPAVLTPAQGPLAPSASPGPTMKSLDQVEPRTAITSLPFIISSPGSYYLTGNLSSTGDALVIQSGHVTVDLCGFTLAGDGIGGGIGILIEGLTNDPFAAVVVRSGIITAFYYGMHAKRVSNSRFEQLSFVSNTSYGIFFTADGAACNDNVLSDCNVSMGGQAVTFDSSNGMCRGNILERCVMNSNGGDGIVLYGRSGQCVGNRITGCTVNSNAWNGIGLLGGAGPADCSGNLISDCTLSANHMCGVYAVGNNSGRCNGNQIQRCSITSNRTAGIYFYGWDGECRGNTVRDCTISLNDRRGIYGEYLTGNRIRDNTFGPQYGTTTYGILLENSSYDFVSGNYACGNTTNYSFSANTVYGPIVTAVGELATTGASAHPWANFSY